MSSGELKHMSSGELKTSKFSLVLRTRENSYVFNTLDEIYLVFTSKIKYSLFILICNTIAVAYSLLS